MSPKMETRKEALRILVIASFYGARFAVAMLQQLITGRVAQWAK